MKIRPSAIAGKWYTSNPYSLAKELDTYLSTARSAQEESFQSRAILMPHAGYRYSGETAAYSAVHIDPKKIKRFIILAPSHHVRFQGLSIPDVDAYETPLGFVMLDKDGVSKLKSDPLVSSYERAHKNEHAIEIELPFLQRLYSRIVDEEEISLFTIVPILVGRMSPEEIEHAANLIRPLLTEDTLLLISGDFTHYGPNYNFVPFEPSNAKEGISQIDHEVFKHLESYSQEELALDQDKTTICAMGPLRIAVATMKTGPKPKLLKYMTSGELMQNYENSVSYLSIIWPKEGEMYVPDLDARPITKPLITKPLPDILTNEELKGLHDLALYSLKLFVEGDSDALQKAMNFEVTDKANKPHGAFVTLKKNGSLRGCIGFILPNDRSLKSAIVQNAMNAALRDPRFRAVTPDELPSLSVEISVLSDLLSITNPRLIQLGRHGIYIKKHGRSAVFLPEVPTEQGWNLLDTLQHLCQKAMLPKDAWKSDMSFEIFTTQVYEAKYHEVTKP